MAQKSKLQGVIPAIVSPMNADGTINFKLLEKQAEYLLNAGVNGLFVCGGTGEGAYLTTQEKKEIYKKVREVAGNKVFLCLAVINSNTQATIEEMKLLIDCDADYWVSTTPFYHSTTQRDIMAHFKAVAQKAPSPIIVYNIPSATHNPIHLETINELSQVDNIAGIKDSSGDFIQFSRGLFGRRSEKFSWIQGEDYLCGASLLGRCDGIVSGLSNAKVEPYVEMYKAYKEGNTDKIIASQRKINFLYEVIQSCGNGNAAIKTVTELNGRGARWMRQGSFTLSDEQISTIARIMEEYEKL
jgi:4-hydroxy-tetrahydrodipicolinate synthase